jgi:hypothetical protein
MRKVIAGILGILAGYIAYSVVKAVVFILGSYTLGPTEVHGPRAAANIGGVAEILGFIVLVLVTYKLYKFIAGKKVKTEAAGNTAEKNGDSSK